MDTLDHVNVRRIMFYIEKQIRQKARERSFEQHDTPEEFLDVHTQCVRAVLQDVKVRKGIFNFNIEQINPTEFKALIYFREDSEPMFMNWWWGERNEFLKFDEVDWVKEGF